MALGEEKKRRILTQLPCLLFSKEQSMNVGLSSTSHSLPPSLHSSLLSPYGPNSENRMTMDSSDVVLDFSFVAHFVDSEAMFVPFFYANSCRKD
jgi:hypothetical protein